MADTPKLTMPEISTSQSSKEVTHNDALWILDALVQPSIEDKDLTAPPGSPVSGACYIPAATATGDWAGHEDDIAQYKATAWEFYTPSEGWKVWVRDENKTYYYTGSAWAEDTGGGASAFTDLSDVPSSYSGQGLKDVRVNSGASALEFYTPPYDVGGFVAGVPTASQVLLQIPLPRAVIFTTSLTGSQGVAGTAATAQTDFDIQKNGVSFGTMRFAAAGTVATFISAAGATFAAGDILKIVAPGTPDATLADVGFMLIGTR